MTPRTGFLGSKWLCALGLAGLACGSSGSTEPFDAAAPVPLADGPRPDARAPAPAPVADGSRPDARARASTPPTDAAAPVDAAVVAAGADAARADGAGGPLPAVAYRATPCAFEIPEGRRVECGEVVVPEARDGRSARVVRLAVARVRRAAAATRPDPVVYLAGGPGDEAIRPMIAALGRPNPILDAVAPDRDVVLVDQRGTGLSLPHLGCPEVDLVTDTGPASDPAGVREIGAAARAGLAACRARLVAAGVDPGAFVTAAAADDVEDVRRALGVARWNLFAVSYGTRLALEVLRRHPGGVRAAALDSVLPPQVDSLEGSAPGIARALDAVLAQCRAQPACDAAYPQLPRVLRDLLRKHAAKPPTLVLANNRKLPFTPGATMDFVTLLLYKGATTAMLPEYLFQLRDETFAFIELAIDQYAAIQRTFSLGLNMSVICADERPFAQRDRVLTAAAAVDPELRPWLVNLSYFGACEVWNVPASPAVANEPVRSDVPALVLSGALDPVTPAAWGALAARTLSRSFAFTLEGEAHGLSSTACGAEAIARFFDDPAARPSLPCLSAPRTRAFSVRR